MPTKNMDADTKERHDTLLHGENQLTNGHREDHETLVTQVVILSKNVRVLLAEIASMKAACTGHKKPGFINWPTASIVLGIIFTLQKILTSGATP